jgi:poly-gamma-glutamate biosynthesis protein PgsC/CapC
MISVLAFAIGLGLVVSLIFIELFSVAAGGLIVPGYVALYMARPLDVILTLLAAGATLLVVRSVSPVAIVYGRRRTVLILLIGFVVGALLRTALQVAVPEARMLAADPASVAPFQAALFDLTVIGYIVPGLIAIWFDRQGVVVTCASLLIAATVVRLLLMLLIPTELMWFEAQQAYVPEPVGPGVVE